MSTLTQNQFLSYQNTFYRYVIASPMIIQLGVQDVVPSTGDFLEDFSKANNTVASNEYPTTWYNFPAFYQRDIDPYSRERYGLTDIHSGSVYLSPIQIKDVFGSFDYLDARKVIIKLDGHSFIVQKLEYKEPLFNSCIAVEFILNDMLDG